MDSTAQQLELLLSSYLCDDHTLLDTLPWVLRTVSTHDLLQRLARIIEDGGDEGAALKDSPARRAISALHKWTVRINSLLSAKSAEAHWVACCLIRASADRAYGAFQKDMRSWCNGLLAASKTIPDAYVGDILATTSTLLLKSKSFPSLQRDLNQMYLAKHVAVMCDRVGKVDAPLEPFLTTLRSMIVHFPNGVRSQSEKIEILCLQTAMRPIEDTKTVQLAISCLLDLSRVNKEKGTTGSEWKLLDRICASLDDVLDVAFSCVEDAPSREDRKVTALNLPAVEGDYQTKLPILASQIKALCACACKIVSETKAGISVTKIVELVRRIYAITTRVQMSDAHDSDARLLRLVLPTLCLDANSVLRELLSRGLVHDFRFVSTICGKSLDMSRHHRSLRVSSYHLVSSAIQAFDCEFVKLSLDTLSKEILGDMSLHAIVRRDAASSGQPATKKRKLEVADATADAHTPESWELKLEALYALEHLFLFGQSQAVEGDLTPLVQSVLSSLLAATTATLPASTIHWKSFETPLHAYQHALLKCLFSAVECGSGRNGDVIPIAIRLFAAFLYHPDMKIQDLCKKGLILTDLIIHPRLPRFEYSRVDEEKHSSPLDPSATTTSETAKDPMEEEPALSEPVVAPSTATKRTLALVEETDATPEPTQAAPPPAHRRILSDFPAPKMTPMPKAPVLSDLDAPAVAEEEEEDVIPVNTRREGTGAVDAMETDGDDDEGNDDLPDIVDDEDDSESE
ncbi:hypothetical protein HKX48_007657 [Thoreauomyces humboldtii]|nr:hypothetical protein HKX48_007657 [Thoreauomyces humboldtii]